MLEQTTGERGKVAARFPPQAPERAALVWGCEEKPRAKTIPGGRDIDRIPSNKSPAKGKIAGGGCIRERSKYFLPVVGAAVSWPRAVPKHEPLQQKDAAFF